MPSRSPCRETAHDLVFKTPERREDRGQPSRVRPMVTMDQTQPLPAANPGWVERSLYHADCYLPLINKGLSIIASSSGIIEHTTVRLSTLGAGLPYMCVQGGGRRGERRCVFCKRRCVRQVEAPAASFASSLLLPLLPAHRGADCPARCRCAAASRCLNSALMRGVNGGQLRGFVNERRAGNAACSQGRWEMLAVP